MNEFLIFVCGLIIGGIITAIIMSIFQLSKTNELQCDNFDSEFSSNSKK